MQAAVSYTHLDVYKRQDVDKTMEAMKSAGDTPYVVGTIEAGEKGVTLC